MGKETCFFTGCNFRLPEEGISTAQGRILRKRIIELGGTVVEEGDMGEVDKLESLYIIQAGKVVTLTRKNSKWNYASVDWLNKCLSLRKLIETDYERHNMGLQLVQDRLIEGIEELDSDQEQFSDEDISGSIEEKTSISEVYKDSRTIDVFSDSDSQSSSDVEVIEVVRSDSVDQSVKGRGNGETQKGKKRKRMSFNSKTGINSELIANLESLKRIHEMEGDGWRTYSYTRAINSLKKCNIEISSLEDAQRLPGIGKGILRKISEILTTGHIHRLNMAGSDREKFQVTTDFQRVWGIGVKTSEMLYKQGYRSLEEIEVSGVLTKNQRIGLKYFEELEKRIPRGEVREIGEYVRKFALQICPNSRAVICGSYRRGSSTCGDVDILLMLPKEGDKTDFLPSLLVLLKKSRFLTDDLSSGDDMHYMGVCKLDTSGLHRRIDIKVYPEDQYAFALLHFTGSAEFNRRIRLKALRQGYSLSDHGLVRVLRFGKEKYASGASMVCKTEEAIFEALGLPYEAPNERNG